MESKYMKLSFNRKYFKKYIRESHYVHEPAPVTYQTFIIGTEKYFQLDCYKKNINIEKNGALEQSDQKLQFDKNTAREFIDLLKKEFEIS
jgi:hypothetical protein